MKSIFLIGYYRNIDSKLIVNCESNKWYYKIMI